MIPLGLFGERHSNRTKDGLEAMLFPINPSLCWLSGVLDARAETTLKPKKRLNPKTLKL